MHFILPVSLLILLFNRKYFPFAFILLNTNILEFGYGLKLEIFRFGGGVIFLRDIYILIIIYLIISSKIKCKIYYSKLFIIIGGLFISGLLASLVFGFDFNIFVRVARLLLFYLSYVYLGLYFLENTDNFYRFGKILFIFVILSVLIQIYEITVQKRIIIDAIANYENKYFIEGVYLKIPYFGRILYSWNRMLSFMPLALFYSGYLLLKKEKILHYLDNKYIFTFCISAYFLSLSRMGIFIAGLTLIIYLSFSNIKNYKYAFLIGIIILGFIKYGNNIKDIFYLRVLSAQDMVNGSSGSLNVRLEMINNQINLISESPIIGQGFNDYNYSSLNGDVGITNIITLFGILGAILPIYIIIKSIKGSLLFIKSDNAFFISFMSILIPLFFAGMFTADIYLSGSIMLIPLLSIMMYRYNLLLRDNVK
jgi:hypothetical protein